MNNFSNLQQVLAELEPLREKLLGHPIYRSVSDVESLQTFMESHSFAVWDFMTLLKAMQRKLSCVEVPWIPPQDTLAARLVNEIVLCEESDEIAPGHYRGHYDLYVEAMGEIDANGRLILEFVEMLKNGRTPGDALASLPLPQSTKTFVLTTLDIAQNGTSHEIAAAFLLGREDIIPEMFQRVLDRLKAEHQYSFRSFETYLQRHIEVDADTHGPMGKRILENLCGTDPKKWQAVYEVASRAISARIMLWDGILEQITAT